GIFQLTDDPPENSCRPSVDYLFRSLAAHYGKGVLGIIMTGMGADGAKSLELIKKADGLIATQDPSSCTVYGMPKEAIKTGHVDLVIPLQELADFIRKAVFVTQHG
ncbi:MAG: CheB methylesterase domain-containing protein, partial [Planctomycetota bacterium]